MYTRTTPPNNVRLQILCLKTAITAQLEPWSGIETREGDHKNSAGTCAVLLSWQRTRESFLRPSY